MIPKFRAWDSYHEKVVEVLSIDFEDKIAYVEQANGDRYEVHFDNLIFLQSTGLKDKNGVEIYEGDFCIQRGEEPYSDENMTLDEDWEFRGVIKFQDFAYWLQDSEGFLKWLGTDCDEIEVIGNVWEDGDLINDGKGAKEN